MACVLMGAMGRLRVASSLLLVSAAVGCGAEDVSPPAGASLPSAPVEILVDDGGVSHVYASDDRDAFFGAGYAQARDRLFQMDMARRRAHGRWAEVLGPDAVSDDELARAFAWARLGREVSAVTARDNPEEWGILTAWVGGVNTRIDEVLSGRAPLPYGFGPDELGFLPERWDDADPLVVAKMTGFGNDLSLEFEIFSTLAERFAPDAMASVELPRPARDVFSIPPEDNPAKTTMPESGALPPRRRGAFIGPPAPDAQRAAARALSALKRLDGLKVMGSNNWAMDGRFTQDGRPLLAGDPHLGLGFPGTFYAVHINSKDAGGAFDVAGFSFPGAPGVSLGHTAEVAWTATTAFGDVMDIWDVPVASDEASIELAGIAVPIVKRHETIQVAGSDPATFTFFDVPGVGVLLPDDVAPVPVASPGGALLLRWTGFATDEPSQLLGIDRATSLDEFERAVDLQTGLNFNLVAASSEGIALRLGIDLPVRDVAGGVRPWLVLDGADPKTQWTGAMLDRSLLPRGRAEKRGWLQTANNDPYGFTANGRLDDDPWYFGAFFDPGWRAGRAADVLALLASRGSVTGDDMKALQTDVHDNLADDLLPLLTEAWQHAATDPELAALAGRADLARLMTLLTEEWDGEMRRDAPGALVFHALSHFCVVEVLEDDLTVLFQPAFDLEAVFLLKVADLVLRGEYPNSAALLQQGRDAALLGALDRTAALLVERFGSVDPSGYRFADMKISSFRDGLGKGLDFGEAPTDGGEATVNVSPSSFFDGDEVAQRWVSRFGPIIRMVTTFAGDGTPVLAYDFPLGNVADPASPHFGDMTTSWIEGTYRTMPFARAEVEAALESKTVLPAAR